jgi:hypothetical protein
MQNGFIGEIQCSRPKLVNGSENRCFFVFDKKYDECRWFRLTRVTAYGMNVFEKGSNFAGFWQAPGVVFVASFVAGSGREFAGASRPGGTVYV